MQKMIFMLLVCMSNPVCAVNETLRQRKTTYVPTHSPVCTQETTNYTAYVLQAPIREHQFHDLENQARKQIKLGSMRQKFLDLRQEIDDVLERRANAIHIYVPCFGRVIMQPEEMVCFGSLVFACFFNS